MKKISYFLSNNKLIVNIITIMIFLIGIVSLLGIKQDLFPDVTMDAVNVSAFYPGASAKDVEINVLIPIERKIKTISGIDNYTSIAMENRGNILIEIDQNESDPKTIKDKIYRELASVPDLPDEVEDLEIMDLDPRLKGVYEFGVYLDDDKLTEKELYDYVDKLEIDLLQLPGISDVNIEGYRKREIKINVLLEKMKEKYISLLDIVNSIKNRNVRVPSGTIQSVEGEHSIVTIGEFRDPMDVSDVIIRSNFEREQVTIKDIANIEDGFEKEKIKININNHKGVSINVVKESNADIVKTANIIKKYLSKAEKSVPEGIKLTTISDQSITIKSMLDIVTFNAIIGFILVFIILSIFLMDIKVSFWTAFGIPIVLLVTFTFMKIFGFSINIISLGAIAMLIGIIVDNNIVIAESIYKYRSLDYNHVEASYLGLKEVFLPVLASTLTTVVAFIPLLLMGGIMGKIVFVIPIIVIVALVVSVFESCFLMPAHLSHSKTKKQEKKKVKWYQIMENIYEKLLKRILRYRYFILLFFILFLFFAFAISGNTIKKFVVSDDDSSDLIMIKLEADDGKSLDQTYELIQKVEKKIQQKIKAENIISVKSSVGHHNTDIKKSNEGYFKNWALINIQLIPQVDRKINTNEIMNDLRTEINLEDMKEFKKIEIKKQLLAADTGEAVNVKILGNNEDESKKAADEIKSFIKGIEGVVNVEDNYSSAKKELILKFDYSKMASFNLNVQSVAQTVKTAYEGTVATSKQTLDNILDFRVQIANHKSVEKNEDFLMDLLISNNQGKLIRLKDIAMPIYEKSATSIEHKDGEKALIITADFSDPNLTSMEIMNKIQKNFINIEDKYPGVSLSFGGEAENTMESISDLIISFIIALILVYFIMVILFKNLTQPFLIMISIPFGVAGALLAFTAHGMPLSFFGMIGIIGLAGVVVNSCIIMVDCINKSLKDFEGKELISIIASAAKDRLRPVLLTTMTTVFGLLPTAYGIGGSSPLITPIAISLAYGLLFSILLTLIFIPTVYLIRMDLFKYKRKEIR